MRFLLLWEFLAPKVKIAVTRHWFCDGNLWILCIIIGKFCFKFCFLIVIFIFVISVKAMHWKEFLQEIGSREHDMNIWYIMHLWILWHEYMLFSYFVCVSKFFVVKCTWSFDLLLIIHIISIYSIATWGMTCSGACIPRKENK
jgi:hypothetical protein